MVRHIRFGNSENEKAHFRKWEETGPMGMCSANRRQPEAIRQYMAQFKHNVACGIILHKPTHKLTTIYIVQKFASKDRTVLNHKLE